MQDDHAAENGSGPAPPARLEALQAELAATRRALDEAREILGAAARRETDLRLELQSRVRNILATVRSVFARTVESAGPLDEVADHFIGRIDTIARYQSLAVSGAASVDLEQMIRDELIAFQFGDDPIITLRGADTKIRTGIAAAIGLAVHELVTNSIKFGALAKTEGRARLRISWSVKDGRLLIEWLESGISVVGSAPLHHGFGRKYIEQGLPYQLRAETSFGLRPGALTCIMAIPLDVGEEAPI